MLLRRSTRWKLAQWIRRQRFRLAGVVALIALLATASLAGWLQPFEQSFLDLLFELRGDRESTHRVVIVSRQRASDRLPLVVERILGDAPAVVVVSLDTPSPALLARLPCDPRVLYVTRGDERLGRGCAVLRPSHRMREATTVRTHDAAGVRTLTGRVLEMVRSPVADPPSRIAVNFTRSMPAIAAAAVVADTPASGIFGGRVVYVVPEVLASELDTPVGYLGEPLVSAQAVATALDDRALGRSSTLACLWMLVLVLATWRATTGTRPLVSLLALATAWFMAELLAFALFDFLLAGPVAVFAIFGVALVLANTAADRKEAGREVRLRLAGAVKDSMQRGAHRISLDHRFWPMLLQRVGELPGVESMALAERDSESWWIAYRAFTGMAEDDIVERRRDVRRAPYAEPYRTHTFHIVDRYVRDTAVSSVFVPLVIEGDLCGLWVLNHPRPEDLINNHRAHLERVAHQLASEVRAHQLEQRAQQINDQTPGTGDIIDASLSAMENLERERRVMDDVLANSRIGLLMTNLFGEVSYENSVMRGMLADAVPSMPADTDAQALIVALTGMDAAEATARLEHVIERGDVIAHSVTTGGEPGRVLDIRIARAVRKVQGREIVQGLMITAADITSTVESDRARLEVVEVINTRASDLLNVLNGYTGVLAMSDAIEPAERALVVGLKDALGELEKLVRDFDHVTGSEQTGRDAIPLSVQYAVREALRNAAEVRDTPNVRVDIPDRPLVARGHPETIQTAIRLLILDSLELAPEHVEVKITVEEDADELVIHLAIPDVAIPQDLLQLVLQGSQDRSTHAGEDRLHLASNYVRAGGGRLEATSSLREGLHFRILLPRSD